MSTVDILREIELGNSELIKINRNENIQQYREQEFFKARNSILTNICQNTYLRCIYNIAIIVFILLFVKTILVEQNVGSDEYFYGVGYIVKEVNTVNKMLVMLTFMLGMTLLVCPLFCFWAKKRVSLLNHGFLSKCWNCYWLLMYVCYCCIMFYVPFANRDIQATIINKFFLLNVQVFFLAKSYGLVRSNAAHALAYKPHSEMKLVLPTFSTYLYYVFAPTLVYQKKYPRADKINWKRIISLQLELVVLVIAISTLFKMLEGQFRYFGILHETTLMFGSNIISTILISALIHFLLFYFKYHVLMNISAELLRFADKHFYEEWWSTTSFKTIHHSWIKFLNDFSAEYIYKDIVKTILPGYKSLASIFTVLVFGLTQEYVMSSTLGFCVPVILCTWVLSLPASLLRIEHPFMNLLFLALYVCVGGLTLSFYTMEYFARKNCPMEDESIWEYFQIRSLTCNNVQ